MFQFVAWLVESERIIDKKLELRSCSFESQGRDSWQTITKH